MEYPYDSSSLDSVLKTLSGLASQHQSVQNTSTSTSTATSTSTPTPHPSSSHPEYPQQRTQPRQPRESNPAPRHSDVPPKQSTTSNASTITTWPAALRHVMRTVGQNEETQLRIRGLIRSQHTHEQQWWRNREALVSRQQSRGEKKKELDAVLRSIGAPVDEKAITTTKEEKAELDTYDTKVYQASAKMANALISELRSMDIPFFALKQSLILESDHPETTSEPGNTKLSRSELVDLQRRMLGLLEDLCKE
ncbi:Protein of unknown function DUF2458 [Penicillium citrinum]|uniref:Uncharacterized protein n=1 Tax=Penicillium citrinum TaxID=5077 RepID=A0A9W9PEM5_PENCI|nr:Protein of unknown function DUF2458 [Penicillium citrinum]KAJ5242442.1 Protein of unknown function DUF2458 [Penicillium citrinum]